MSFAHARASPDLLRAVARQGYTDPTPVQREAIPLVLAGRDLLAGAQTGTGKTAAFVLPILQRLALTRPGATGRRVRVLVLAPTRELAIQVEESVRAYGGTASGRPPSTAASASAGQVAALRRGAEIVVATPGRLLDHVGQGTIDLRGVEILVLDEADRMLDMGFIRDIRQILALLPDRRQNLLFSATFSNEIRRWPMACSTARPRCRSPRENTAAELVEQVIHPVDRERKRELLSHLVRTREIDQALVFTRTKHGANRAGRAAQPRRHRHRGHPRQQEPAAAHASAGRLQGRARHPARRDRGRRARPGHRGAAARRQLRAADGARPTTSIASVAPVGGHRRHAVSLVCVDEAPLLRDIERLLGAPIPSEVIPGFEPDRSIPPQPIRLRSGQRGPGRQAPGRRQAPPAREPAPLRWGPPPAPAPRGEPSAARNPLPSAGTVGGVIIRLADPDRDADAVAAIYRPSVGGGLASFEEVAPDAAEMGGTACALRSREGPGSSPRTKAAR